MSNGGGWPWTPATAVQGFLSGRWLRRDGAIYNIEPPVPPQVLSTSWLLNMPTVVGAIVGSCGFSGSLPTSWRISQGNQDGYWAISQSGLVTVAQTGMFEGVIYEISVVASNGAGASNPTEMFIHTVTGANSPIAGGEDADAKVDTSSGVPRAWPNRPSGRASTTFSGLSR